MNFRSVTGIQFRKARMLVFGLLGVRERVGWRLQTDSAARKRGFGAGVHLDSPGFEKELQRVPGRKGRGLRGLSGRVLRFSWSERRRQDHDDEDDLRRLHPDSRGTYRRGPGREARGAPGKTAHRGRAAGEQPRRRPQGQREPARLRQVFRSPQENRAAEGRRTAGVRTAHGEGEFQGGTPLGRHEAAATHRPGPHKRPRDRGARRADDGVGPAGPASGVGPAAGTDAGEQNP